MLQRDWGIAGERVGGMIVSTFPGVRLPIASLAFWATRFFPASDASCAGRECCGEPLCRGRGAGVTAHQFGLGEDMALHAIDKSNGRDLWQGTLPARSFGNPMTYRTRSGKQFIVIAVGQGSNTALVAFSGAGL